LSHPHLGLVPSPLLTQAIATAIDSNETTRFIHIPTAHDTLPPALPLLHHLLAHIFLLAQCQWHNHLKHTRTNHRLYQLSNRDNLLILIASPRRHLPIPLHHSLVLASCRKPVPPNPTAPPWDPEPHRDKALNKDQDPPRGHLFHLILAISPKRPPNPIDIVLQQPLEAYHSSLPLDRSPIPRPLPPSPLPNRLARSPRRCH
jgi:hypothetical protein